MFENEELEISEKPEPTKKISYETLRLVGNEPIWTNVSVFDADYNSKYLNALNWANYVFDDEQLKHQVQIYFKHNNKDFSLVENAKPWRFNHIGKICWLINNNCPMKDSTKQLLNTKIKELEINASEDSEQELSEEPIKKMKKSEVKEILHEQKLSNIISSIDDKIDDMTINAVEADIYNILNDHEVESFIAKELKKYYEDKNAILKEELKLVKHDTTLQENELETYINDLNKNIVAIEHIYWQINSYLGNNKATRTSKTYRSKMSQNKVEKATKNVKFKTYDSTFKVQSIPLDRIVGAQLLLTFNTKNRNLSMFYALNDDGLQIKGTTILNYDEKKSVQKKLRKPEKLLSHLQQNSVHRANVVFNGLSTKADLPNGRLNQYTILLKAFKTLNK